MFSLTYSPAYDAYNTVFRFMALARLRTDEQPVKFDAFRIADFYHCFPWLLRDFKAYTKIPNFLKDKNQIVRAYRQPRFEILPDKRIVFERMFPSQMAARAAVFGSGNDSSTLDFSSAHTQPRTDYLTDRIDQYCSENKALLTFLADGLVNVPLFGVGGLKDRSELGEIRYDNV